MNNELTVTLQVNGEAREVAVASGQTLLQTLRETLGLDGARSACGIGMCGSCTVLVDGRVISSCLMLTAQAAGKAITTIEGLSKDGQLHPLQQAFIDHSGFQCAYCTPGFILSSVALLDEHPDPDEHTIREYLAGNLCRCGSYVNILKAVQAGRRS